MLKFKKISELDACQRALEEATLQGAIARENWEVGKTRVFLKDSADKSDLEKFRNTKIQHLAVKIQSVFRMYRTRKSVFKEKFELQRRLALNRAKEVRENANERSGKKYYCYDPRRSAPRGSESKIHWRG